MAQGRIQFTWRIGAEAYDDALRRIDTGLGGTVGLPAVLQRLARRYWSAALYICLPFLLASGSAQFAERQAIQQLQSEIQAQLDLEVQALLSDNQERHSLLIDPEVSQDWQREWTRFFREEDRSGYSLTTGTVTRHEEYLQADVWMIPPPRLRQWQTTPLLETRFYRKVEGQWLRTVPPASFWGPRIIHEGSYLHLIYAQQDEGLMQAAVSDLENDLIRLYRLLGLTLPEDGKPLLTIHVEAVNSTRRISYRRIRVASPAFMWPRWRDYRAEEHFADTITARLVSDTINRYFRDRSDSWRSFFYTGINDWLVAELASRPHPWLTQADVILAADIENWWPLTVDELARFRPIWDPAGKSDPLFWARRQRAAYWLLVFVVEEKEIPLTTFIDTLSRHYSWTQFITDLLDLSLEEFETEWNRFLLQHYQDR